MYVAQFFYIPQFWYWGIYPQPMNRSRYICQLSDEYTWWYIYQLTDECSTGNRGIYLFPNRLPNFIPTHPLLLHFESTCRSRRHWPPAPSASTPLPDADILYATVRRRVADRLPARPCWCPPCHAASTLTPRMGWPTGTNAATEPGPWPSTPAPRLPTSAIAGRPWLPPRFFFQVDFEFTLNVAKFKWNLRFNLTEID
jgi:hypothetical protein